MIFQLLALTLILLLTMYMATQGTLTAILAFASAMFGSILAMGITESAQGVMGARWPELGKGATFLIVFMLAFGILRYVSDKAVPRNVQLPPLADKVAGAVAGLLAAVTVVGTLALGVEMLPFGGAILGFDPFPGGPGTPDEPAQAASLWIPADNFVIGMWDVASDGSLGSFDEDFSRLHPNYQQELWAGRHTVMLGSRHVLANNLLHVEDAVVVPDVTSLGMPPAEGRSALVVRTKIDAGDEAQGARDPDNLFRITPAEVRLVTTKGHQLNPVGYLDHGTRFVSLVTGPTDKYEAVVADDFPPAGFVNHDWVFLLPADPDDKPSMLEVKEDARVRFKNRSNDPDDWVALKAGTGKGAGGPFGVLAKAYPTDDYKTKNAGTLDVTVMVDKGNGSPEPAAGQTVYAVENVVKIRQIHDQIHAAYDTLEKMEQEMESNPAKWKASLANEPGVPSKGEVHSLLVIANGQEGYINKGQDETVSWQTVLPLLLAAKTGPDVSANVRNVAAYADGELKNLIINSPGGYTPFTTDAKGDTGEKPIATGGWFLYAVNHDDKQVTVWGVPVSVKTNDPKAPGGGVTFQKLDNAAVLKHLQMK